MISVDFIEQLNTLLSAKREKGEELEQPQIFCGDILFTLASVVSKKLPLSRVAVLYTEKSFKEFSKPLTDLLNAKGLRVFNLVVSPEKVISTNDCADALIVPDDVRAYVTFDNSLVSLAKYVASIKNVPFVYGDAYHEFRGVLDNTAVVKNGNVYDEFPLSCPVYAFVDTASVKLNSPAENYIYSLAYLAALTDYRVYCAIIGVAPSDSAYALAKTAVLEDYGVLKNADVNSVLYKSVIELEVASYLTGGILKKCSGVFSAEKAYVLANGKSAGAYNLFLMLKAVINLYSICFNPNAELLSIVDYVSLTQSAIKNCKLQETTIIKNLNKFFAKYSKNRERVDLLLKNLYPELVSHFKTLSVIEKTYFALGGKAHKAGRIASFIQNGAVISPFSALGVLTEKGFIGLIK